MTDTLRSAFAVVLGLLALPLLAVGTLVIHAGRTLDEVADRISPDTWTN